jgi:hypothetical protein
VIEHVARRRFGIDDDDIVASQCLDPSAGVSSSGEEERGRNLSWARRTSALSRRSAVPLLCTHRQSVRALDFLWTLASVAVQQTTTSSPTTRLIGFSSITVFNGKRVARHLHVTHALKVQEACQPGRDGDAPCL